MTEQQNTQIDALMGVLVSHQRFLRGLSKENRQWALQNPKDAIALFCDAANNRSAKTKTVEKLFEFVTSFRVPGTEEFVVAKRFVIDTSENARVRISGIGCNFRENFLPRVERDIAASSLVLSKLGRRQHDLPMSPEELGTIAGLGGLTKAETSAYDFYETLAYKQATSDLTVTVSYTRATDENSHRVLWALHGYWVGGGWHVDAYLPDCLIDWCTGNEFVSH